MEALILAEVPGAFVELCGVSCLERLLRMLQRCGLRRAMVLSSEPERISEHLRAPSWARKDLEVRVAARACGPVTVEQLLAAWPGASTGEAGRAEAAEGLWFLPAAGVYDSRLLRLMAERREPGVLVDSKPVPELEALVCSATPTMRGLLCGPAIVDRAWARGQCGLLETALIEGLTSGALPAVDIAAQPTYSLELRRDLRLLWLPAPMGTDGRRAAERLLLDAAQKGSLDLPAWVHAPIETFLVSRLCKTDITPNQLTLLCNLAAWTATFFLAVGRLGLGTAIALAVGVLDGLDGKQARVKVETSKAGELEHWLDTLYELSWAVALAYSLRFSGQLPEAFWYLFLLLGAEAVDAVAKGGIILTYGRLIDELSTLDRAIRLVGGRRNIYVWILAISLLFGAPAVGFVVMAWWEAVTAAVHLPRAAWALWVRPYRFSPDPKG
jgi:phosphatidylglycerophosphate synthase